MSNTFYGQCVSNFRKILLKRADRVHQIAEQRGWIHFPFWKKSIIVNTFAYDIKNARVQSSLFNIVPADSILDISPQDISGIAAGNWVFLKPGAPQSGNHEISFTRKWNGTRSDASYSLDRN
jgi:hypothetical protein